MPFAPAFRPLFVLPKLFSTATAATSKPSSFSSAASTGPLPSRKTFSHIFQECATQRDLVAGMAAHARMITSGFTPTVFVANCLVHMYVRCCRLAVAREMFDHLTLRDTVSWNVMIAGYVQNGLMGAARELFDSMPWRDVISWNSLVSGYLQEGNYRESIELFLRMRRGNVGVDHTTFAVVLKSCSGLEDSELGSQVHGLAVRMGLDADVMTGSALIDMYAKCGYLEYSLKFFREMPQRNLVSWSAAIAGCAQNEQLIDGLNIFKEMLQAGVQVGQHTYASVFRSCAGMLEINLGKQVHAHALKSNFSGDTIVGTAILDMYAKCNSLEEAKRAFQLLPQHSLESWNAMVVGHTRNCQCLQALEIFQLMNRYGVGVDEISLSGVLRACAGVEGCTAGLQVHTLAIKNHLDSDICVANAILDMYGKCGMLVEAYNIFDQMHRKDPVSWNAIIAALEQNGKYDETLLHFDLMLWHGMEPDEFTYGSVLKACASLLSLDNGIRIHDRLIKSGLGLDPFVGSALVDMYCKCGLLEEGLKLHDRIEEQTNVSWNAVISGFSLQRKSGEAQSLFSSMLDKGQKPDNFTYATVLDICANLAIVGLGKQIHAQIIKQQLERDVYISSTVVDMYSKCGNMHDSLQMFEEMQECDVVSWNAIISGYAQHGLGEEALRIFGKMKTEDIKPNHATFVSVLRACAHVGLVSEGLWHFHSMLQDFKLDPQLEHYSCMVDIVGRSGRVHDAMKMIHDMPCEADAVIWRTLLNVCKTQRNVEIAEVAAQSVLQFDPDDSAAYILLSNIYAEAGRWGEVSRMRQTMRQNKLKKEPGCSWIEVNGVVNAFLVGDQAHPRCGDIYEILDVLISEMTVAGYVPNIDLILLDEEEEQRYNQELLNVCNS